MVQACPIRFNEKFPRSGPEQGNSILEQKVGMGMDRKLES